MGIRHKLDQRHAGRLRKRQLADRRGGEGVGEEPNHMTARGDKLVGDIVTLVKYFHS
jgi:hypothetical protein